LDDLNLAWRDRIGLAMTQNNKESSTKSSLAHFKMSQYLDFKLITPSMYDEYYKFSIIRHPYNRAFSLYKFLGFSLLIDFEDFVLNYLAISLWKKDYWIVEPQVEFVYDDAGILLVDYLYQIEDLSMRFSELREKANLKCSALPEVNRSNNSKVPYKRSKAIRKNYPELTKVNHSLSSTKIVDNVNQRILDKLNSLYQRDFEVLPYKQEIL
jgi:hypothetical protein